MVFIQEIDEELERELEEESETEEVEYIEADSDLEAELEAEDDIEDSKVPVAGPSKKKNIKKSKPKLEIEYETVSTSKMKN